MSYLIWKVFTRSKIEHFHIRYDCMIDGNILQTADLNGHVTVKSLIRILKVGMHEGTCPRGVPGVHIEKVPGTSPFCVNYPFSSNNVVMSPAWQRSRRD